MKILEPRTSFQPSATLTRGEYAGTTATSPKSPAEAVRLAVHSMDHGILRPCVNSGAGLAYQPESLLALLVYCYSRGIYSSLEIEASLWRDRPLRELAGEDVPCARVLQRFRRNNREPLHRCLMAVLGYLSGRITPVETDGAIGERTISEEAHCRIAQAMFIDQMESEAVDF